MMNLAVDPSRFLRTDLPLYPMVIRSASSAVSMISSSTLPRAACQECSTWFSPLKYFNLRRSLFLRVASWCSRVLFSSGCRSPVSSLIDRVEEIRVACPHSSSSTNIPLISAFNVLARLAAALRAALLWEEVSTATRILRTTIFFLSVSSVIISSDRFQRLQMLFDDRQADRGVP